MEEARMLKERNKKNILFKLGTYETIRKTWISSQGFDRQS